MFNPLSFLELAEKLNSSKPIDSKEEATVRTVVSRAYYAAHLYVREKLRKIFPQELTDTALRQQGRSEHAKVRSLLFKRGKREIADKHTELFYLRVKADYKLIHQMHPRDATKSISLAKRIIELSDRGV